MWKTGLGEVAPRGLNTSGRRQLLDAKVLARSEIVANVCMNRERNLSGANSYEKDLGMNPLDFLLGALKDRGEASWLDLCCGTGRALFQAAEAIQSLGFDRNIKLVGVDLVPMFVSLPSELTFLELICASAESWDTGQRFDLITCVHGLHYVGDKLHVVRKTSGWMKEKGLVLMHLDYRNLKIAGDRSTNAWLGRDFRRAGFQWVRGRHLLKGSGRTHPDSIPYRYLGADDMAGPNFTGQAAVDSHYERI